MLKKEQIINKAEEIADDVLRHTKHILPHLAHCCLVATFVEDAIRMCLQFQEQVDYFSSGKLGPFFGYVFIIYNLVAQFVGSGMVLCRFRVRLACVILGTIIALQTFFYNINYYFDYSNLLRALSLSGALLFLLAETWVDEKTTFAGVPTLGSDPRPKSYMQLIGRVLLVGMFMLSVGFHRDFFWIVQSIFSLCLIILVTVGYKTRLSALILVVWLSILNFRYHQWWRFSLSDHIHDYLRYDFFQMISIIGGLLLLISLGPGNVSVDEKKKKW